MPVPVPPYSKQPAHPVIKINQSLDPDFQPSVFQHLTHSLPLPPSGPPPSFATREEWISSLPSWRRNKPRRIWEEGSSQHLDHQDFVEGLAVADNATVIKGAPAQACIPPVSTLLAAADSASHPQYYDNMYPAPEMELDEGLSSFSARIRGWRRDIPPHSDCARTNAEYEDMDVENVQDSAAHYDSYGADTPESFCDVSSGQFYSMESYERGAFSPIFEDMSPEAAGVHDPASSPIGPATPFGEFVDRAVAAAHLIPAYEGHRSADNALDLYGQPEGGCGGQCQQCQIYGGAEQALLPPPAPEPVVTPSATVAYKKLAEPLSEWIAAFVWKVCTTGKYLPSAYAQPSAFVKHYASAPPSHLASATHSMLLSTLLQPSAIFLALRYLVHLPVFFGPVNLDRDQHRKEIYFRTELLGEAHLSYDRADLESYAPFRLILLGCMLANKWLDDHTFSNKTWHTISNVPVRALNKLEFLALDIFEYNLAVSPDEWSEWLSQILDYHKTLNSSSCPQPISRPSSSPYTIIRKSIESLRDLHVALPVRQCGNHHEKHAPPPPEPVFVGAEERKREQQEVLMGYDDDVDVLEIDLDENGPLREEYLPRRRISGAGSNRRSQAYNQMVDVDRVLPPPAKWSPEADEPLQRGNLRVPRHYVAPRPIQPVLPPPPPAAPLPFHQVLDPHRSAWYGGYLPKQEHVFLPEPAPVYHHQPTYGGYDYGYPIAQSHARSQSLSYNQAVVGQAQGRLRSYSQSRFDQGYSTGDLRISPSHFYQTLPPMIPRWGPTDAAVFSLYDRPFEYQRPLKV